MAPNSLSARIYGLAVLVGLAVLLLAGLLLTAAERTREGFMWVEHTEEVLRAAETMHADMLEAESGQRSFLLTRQAAYLESFADKVANSRHQAASLVTLTPDNPGQHARAIRLQHLVATRARLMERTIAVARTDGFEAATATVARGEGKAAMDALSAQTEEMMAVERELLKSRLDKAEQLSRWTRTLLLAGVPALGLFFATLILLLVAGVKRPLRNMLTAMSGFGAGRLDARAPIRTGTREFDDLAICYNEMAAQLSAAIDRQRASDEKLNAANRELVERGKALGERSRSTQLLAAMAHRMQACQTDEELNAVLRSFLPQVLTGTAGILYVHNNSRNMLTRMVEWGAPRDGADHFAPEDCWGLRRGQSHVVASEGSDVACAHHGSADPYRCEPILAGGEVIGLLYLEGILGEEERFRISILVENVALSLVNHRLQRSLREQSIRDPLTKLFNRRYMEEALAIEAARSIRSLTPLGIVMCDVDHFKRFNDLFGHEAGDALLEAIGGLIRLHFRDGDIACRYGGEEFAIIAPGADAEQLAKRAERLRLAVAELAVQHHSRTLADVTMSFGIASRTVGADGDTASILRAADGALYEAKGRGRNRVVTAQDAPRLEAAAE